MMSVKDPGAGRESGIHDQEVVADTHWAITGDHSLAHAVAFENKLSVVRWIQLKKRDKIDTIGQIRENTF